MTAIGATAVGVTAVRNELKFYTTKLISLITFFKRLHITKLVPPVIQAGAASLRCESCQACCRRPWCRVEVEAGLRSLAGVPGPGPRSHLEGAQEEELKLEEEEQKQQEGEEGLQGPGGRLATGPFL